MNSNQFFHEECIQEILDNKIVSLEFFNFFLGERLGSGCFRHVFSYKPDPKWVIKIDVGNTNANICEFNYWNDLSETDFSQWLAPCGNMSPCGRILMQRKCKPLKSFPEMIPKCFTDVKFDNWGLFKGRPVCFDYGLILSDISTKLVPSKSKLNV